MFLKSRTCFPKNMYVFSGKQADVFSRMSDDILLGEKNDNKGFSLLCYKN